MKRVLCLALAISSFSALAVTDSNVWDVQFLPKKGTVSGTSSLTLGTGEISPNGSGKDADVSSSGLAQNIGYSFTDRILISADVSYEHLRLDGNTTSNYNGWTDPVVNGRFRLLDDEFRLDLLAGFAVPLGEGRSGTGGNGNFKGENDFYFGAGPRLYLGAEIGQKIASGIQYSLLLRADHVLDTDDHVQGLPVRSAQSHTNWMTQATFQNLLVEKLYLRTFAAVRFIEGYDKEASGLADTSVAPITDLRFGTGLHYAVTPDLLANVSVTYRDLSLNSGQVDDFHMWMWNFGARYQY